MRSAFLVNATGTLKLTGDGQEGLFCMEYLIEHSADPDSIFTENLDPDTDSI
jgi:hypothetical protein